MLESLDCVTIKGNVYGDKRRNTTSLSFRYLRYMYKLDLYLALHYSLIHYIVLCAVKLITEVCTSIHKNNRLCQEFRHTEVISNPKYFYNSDNMTLASKQPCEHVIS